MSVISIVLSAVRNLIGGKMSDLIKRQDAIDAALTFLVEYCGAAFDEDMQKMLCERLDALPSVEVPERKTGEWLPHPGEREWDVCSVCGIGCKWREYEMQYGMERETEYNYPYCPHCGAEMK